PTTMQPAAQLAAIRPEHVLRAIPQFDTMGREAFLARYGFRRSRGYMLERDGRLYDSKALLGAAYQWASDGSTPLTYDKFNGGVSQTVKILTRLGFTVRTLSAKSKRDSSDLLPSI